jgi:hypothetical protein
VAELTDLEAALWEIENLVRAPLSPAEEAIFIDRRRELREELYGKAKALGAVAANAVMGRKHATAKLAGASSFLPPTPPKRPASLHAPYNGSFSEPPKTDAGIWRESPGPVWTAGQSSMPCR